jgi:peptidoglycan/LPS O-acetylase OafA/YrhL
MSAGPRHYRFLDALRGIAVLGVVAVHTVQNFPWRRAEPVLYYGAFGVTLFYIVSAFSLCLSLDQRRRVERHPILNYAIRRFFRIAPMFYVAIVIYLLKPLVLPARSAPVILDPITWSLEGWHVLVTALFVNGWHYQSINLVVPGGWSVAVETNFYLLLPFLFRRATSLRRALTLTGASIIASVVLRKVLYLLVASRIPPADMPGLNVFAGLWLPNQLPVFMLGIVMFRLVDRAALAEPEKISGRRVAAVYAGLVAAVLFVRFAPPRAERLFSEHFQIATVLLFGSLLLAYRPYRLLVNSVTAYIGRVSYSVYLMHFVALQLVLWTARSWFTPTFHATVPLAVAFPVVLALAVAISSVTYRLIELPGQKLGQYFIARLEKSAAPTVVAPVAAVETPSVPPRVTDGPAV